MRRWLPHIGVVLGLTIAIYALFFAESDEDKIRARLDQLEDAIRVTADDTNVLVRTAHVKKEFSEIFVKEVSIEISELTDVRAGRDELVALAGNAPQIYRTASVDLDGLTINIDESKTSALAYGDVTLLATLQSGEVKRDTRTVSMRIDKIDGEWVIVALGVSFPGDIGQ
jgi:phosphoribosylformylglycinamidine synthase